MRRRTVGLLAALSILAAAPAIDASAGASSPGVHAACKSATIRGKHKCIAKGQLCQHTSAANHDYHKYGYTCGKRDHSGRYHLKYY